MINDEKVADKRKNKLSKKDLLVVVGGTNAVLKRSGDLTDYCVDGYFRAIIMRCRPSWLFA